MTAHFLAQIVMAFYDGIVKKTESWTNDALCPAKEMATPDSSEVIALLSRKMPLI